jgi:hypothetical protein
MSVAKWRELMNSVKAAGLTSRVAASAATAKVPLYGAKRKSDPTAEQLAKHVPASFTMFVNAIGYPAIDLGRGCRWAMLPPPAMCQVTGAMGDPAQPFDQTRKLRESKKYEWPFAFFAGFDLSDVNGWCFAPPEGGGDPVVWLVEDSLPCEEVGLFDDWIANEIAAMTKAIGSKKKIDALIAQIREDDGLEDDEKLPAISLSSF